MSTRSNRDSSGFSEEKAMEASDTVPWPWKIREKDPWMRDGAVESPLITAI
jgi:hypothetical protein